MTLGLVGLGHVGREVAARGHALGFTVLGYDPVPPGTVPPGVTMVGLDDLLSRSDLVSVHARATADNRHMFGAAAFARMPRGAFFINTARESLVDEDALARALASGTLAGAALDVAQPRPAGDRHPLLDLPNVIITPHIGGATRETLRRGAEMAAAAVARLASGGIPDHRGQSRGPGQGGGTVTGSTGTAGPYLLAIDAGTGSCRALLFTEKGEQVAVSLREWTHREPPGVPGGQDFDVTANWRLISACIRDALAAAGASGGDVAAIAATSMREGIVLYDARRRRDLGLPERGQPRRGRSRGPDPRGQRGTDLRRGGRLGVDHLPGPAALDGAAPARPLRGHPRPGHAQRLDRLPAGRGPGHRAVLRVQLGHVQPGPPDLVGADRGDLRHLPAGAAGGGRPRHRGRRGHRRGRGADRPAGGHPGGRRAAPTPSSGCSGRACEPASSPCWPGPSGRTRCW